jgi:hypothetical protein
LLFAFHPFPFFLYSPAICLNHRQLLCELGLTCSALSHLNLLHYLCEFFAVGRVLPCSAMSCSHGSYHVFLSSCRRVPKSILGPHQNILAR